MHLGHMGSTCGLPRCPEMRRMVESAIRETRPSGHLQVRGTRGQRAWYALWRDGDGRHKKRLGPAHVRESGRRRPRGAIVWRAADGPKPDATCRSPAPAEDELQKLRAEAPREPTDPRHKRDQDRTFAEACDAWLDNVEHEKALRPSTVRDYRNAVGCYLLPEFGATTLLRTIDTRRIAPTASGCSPRANSHDGRSRRSLSSSSRCSSAPSVRAGSTPTLPRTPSASPSSAPATSRSSPPTRCTPSRAPTAPSSTVRSTSPPPSPACAWASCAPSAPPS